MNCGSGTADRKASGQPRCVLRQVYALYSPDGSTFLREMTSWPPSSKCDVKSKMRLRQSMRIYLNNPAKFHPDPIWNDGFLGFLKSVTPTTRGRTRSPNEGMKSKHQFVVFILFYSHLKASVSAVCLGVFQSTYCPVHSYCFFLFWVPVKFFLNK